MRQGLEQVIRGTGWGAPGCRCLCLHRPEVRRGRPEVRRGPALHWKAKESTKAQTFHVGKMSYSLSAAALTALREWIRETGTISIDGYGGNSKFRHQLITQNVYILMENYNHTRKMSNSTTEPTPQENIKFIKTNGKSL